jgi:DNA polymerase beta
MLGANVNKKGKIEKNQKIREGPCIFPFKHQWKEHNECIDNKDKGKICATSVTERGTLKTYGYCTPEQPDRNTHSISKSNNNRVKKGTKKKAPRKKRTLKIVERFPSRSKSRSKSKSATVSPKIQVIGEAVKDKDIKILSKSKSMSKSKSKSMSKSMNNELIDIMDELADIMLRQGEPFKARAYKRASETIMSFPEDIVNVDQLEGKPAIGKTIMEKMIEFQKTGTLRVLERERKNPLNIFTNIYGVGPKKAKQLIEDGITTLTLLKENESKLNDTQKVGLQYYEPLQKRIPRNEIEEFAKVFDTIFKQVAPEGSKYEIVGSYRREAQNSGDIDIIVTNADNNIAAFNTFLDKLIAEDIIIEVLTRGKTKSLTIGKLATNGSIARRIDFLYTEPKEYAFATLYFTGSKAFNTVMRQRAIDLGYTLNEHGLSSMVSGKKGERLTNDFPTEQSIFDFLGMKYKEPKEREGYKSVELLDDQTQPSVEIVQKKDTATQKSKHTNYKEDIMAFKKEGLDALFMLNEKQLATILDEAQKAYYNDSENVLMTDNEFDIIKEYMEKKYPNNKILEQIGAPIQEKNKVSLPYNMPIRDPTFCRQSWTESVPCILAKIMNKSFTREVTAKSVRIYPI